MKRTSIAIATCAAVLAAGMAAALPLHGPAAVGTAGTEAGPSALALGGVATIVHQDGDGNVLGEQVVHNQLLDAGEDFILQQVFMNGRSVADSAQIGAICLSAADPSTIVEGLDRDKFNADHVAAAGTTDPPSADGDTSTIAAGDTHECLTDTAVANSTQKATVGPLVFTANNTATPGSESNWKPSVPIRMIGICTGFSAASEDNCTPPLFAAVSINSVNLNVDETLTVTYEFDMSSSGT